MALLINTWQAYKRVTYFLPVPPSTRLLLLPTEHRPHPYATIRLDDLDILPLSVCGVLSNHEGPVQTKSVCTCIHLEIGRYFIPSSEKTIDSQHLSFFLTTLLRFFSSIPTNVFALPRRRTNGMEGRGASER